MSPGAVSGVRCCLRVPAAEAATASRGEERTVAEEARERYECAVVPSMACMGATDTQHRIPNDPARFATKARLERSPAASSIEGAPPIAQVCINSLRLLVSDFPEFQRRARAHSLCSVLLALVEHHKRCEIGPSGAKHLKETPGNRGRCSFGTERAAAARSCLACLQAQCSARQRVKRRVRWQRLRCGPRYSRRRLDKYHGSRESAAP